MCHKVMCPRCHKPTWTGCGQHIEQCLSDVPYDQRCKCNQMMNQYPSMSMMQTSQYMNPQYLNYQQPIMFNYGYRY